MGGGVFGPLDSILGGDQAIAPVVVLVGHAVGGGAARVLGDLGQVTVANSAAIVHDSTDLEHVRRRRVVRWFPFLAVAGRVVGADPDTYNAPESIIHGAVNG